MIGSRSVLQAGPQSACFMLDIQILLIANQCPRKPWGGGEELGWVRHFETLEELADAFEKFRQRYNEQWLVERLHLQSPRPAHQALLAL